MVDLFTPVVPSDRWHPNFKRLHEHGAEQEKQVLCNWADGFVDRDGKFVIEFQTTFNSSFWELYLFALLRGSSCTVDLSHPRPDFVVTGGALGEFVAEAVIASNPAGGVPEWAGDIRNLPDRENMLDLACLRLSQAVTEKHSKWVLGYADLPQCTGRPFIVCVAPFDQPFASLQGTEAIDRVLFGGPRPVLVRDGEGTVRVLGHARTDAAFKKSGSRVSLGLFTTSDLADVSAVLFSTMATWTKVHAMAGPGGAPATVQAVRWHEGKGLRGTVGPIDAHDETLVDGAQLFLNPHAARPIAPEPWLAAGFSVHEYRPDGTLTTRPDRALMSRFALRTGVRSDDTPPVSPHLPPDGATPHVRQHPPDGVLFGGPSQVGITDSIELMLYKGWTIYVGRDMVDGDWCTLAKAGSHLSIQEFADAPDDDAFMGTFVETREAALTEARCRIDSGATSDNDE